MNIRRKIARIFLLIAIMPLFSACGLTRNLKDVDSGKATIIVGMDETFVPMGFRTKNGKLAGFDIELAREVGKVLNQKIEFQPVDWDLKETELKNGTIDLIWNGYSKTPAREKTVGFSHSYLKNSQIVITRKNAGINSVADLENKKIGLQNGSSGQMLYESKPQLLKDNVQETVLYDTFNNAFLDLKAGRIDAILGDSIYINYYVKMQGGSANYKLVATPFTTETFAIGMRKNDTQLRERINHALKELTKNGKLKKLSQKWFEEDLTIPTK